MKIKNKRETPPHVRQSGLDDIADALRQAETVQLSDLLPVKGTGDELDRISQSLAKPRHVELDTLLQPPGPAIAGFGRASIQSGTIEDLKKLAASWYYIAVKGSEQDLYDYILAKYDGITEEVAKHHAARIHSELTREFSAKADPSLTLPTVAPKLYADRGIDPETGKRVKAIKFLEEVWGAYWPVLCRSDLVRLDPGLVVGVNSQCRNENLDAKAILPPTKYRNVDPANKMERLRMSYQKYNAKRKLRLTNG